MNAAAATAAAATAAAAAAAAAATVADGTVLENSRPRETGRDAIGETWSKMGKMGS